MATASTRNAISPWAATTARAREYVKTTPGQLTATLVTCLATLLLWGLVAWWTWSGVYQAVKTVGKDAAPSIVAAERIRATLADANANAMNAMLVNEGREGPYSVLFRKEIDQVHHDLIAATRNITYGDEEKVPILAIMTGLGRYERIVGRASGKSTAAAMSDYAEANKVMRESILPACTALDQANNRYLEKIYTAHKTIANIAGLLFIVVALLAGAALAWTQWFLFKKTKRLVNVGFAAASGVVLLFTVYWLVTLFSAEANLRLAKQDAFNSIYALWQAKAVAYDANADESLYLLYHGSPAQQKVAEAEFKKKMAQLAVGGKEELEAKALNKQRITGFLGDELANITFEGEYEAAVNTLKAWLAYRALDSQIRALEQNGQHEEAIRLNVGTNEGQSNWAFGQFDQALDQVIAINMAEFDQAIANTLAPLAWFPYVLGVTLILTIGACLGGMKPRLEEYHF